MDLGLKGKNVAISGSSQGIGFAIAAALAKEGCNVALSARGAQGLDAAVKEIQALGVKAVGVVTDFASEEGCKQFVAEAAEKLGGIDILVNNVGGLVPGSLEALTAEQWDKILNLKLMAAVHTTKHALPHLKKAKGARILNVSGVTGRQLLPGSWTTTLTNSAIIGFSKLVAAEVGAAGITVNNICPGFTNVKSWAPRAEAMAKARGTTADQVRAGIAGQTLLGRWAEPEEIGNVAAFLVSAKNSYMTGTTVEVCGGFTRYI
jgi:3-oxoacyl-[acyl-carrier protein] reductase